MSAENPDGRVSRLEKKFIYGYPNVFNAYIFMPDEDLEVINIDDLNPLDYVFNLQITPHRENSFKKPTHIKFKCVHEYQ